VGPSEWERERVGRVNFTGFLVNELVMRDSRIRPVREMKLGFGFMNNLFQRHRKGIKLEEITRSLQKYEILPGC
jgi:hypothetical protein